MELLHSNWGEFIFITAIITLSLAIILGKYTLFIPQVALLAAMLLFPILLEYEVIYYLLLLLHVALVAYAIYMFKKALDLNYRLILETTHKIPRDNTAGGGFGGICKYPR